MGKKYIYSFGNKKAEGRADMKNLLGGKGANIAEMTNLGISVPPGLTITTEVCIEFYNNNGVYPDGLWDTITQALAVIEEQTGAKFGDSENPLLFSIRSGARISMPGMMDTVLNLGLNDSTVKGLARRISSERTAYDCFRRFVTMFGDVVLGVEGEKFEKILYAEKKNKGVTEDTQLGVDSLKNLVTKYKALIKKEKNVDFPDDPSAQLKMAVSAVFESWKNQRAVTYRKLHGIPDGWGTAVNVQAMVFGNSGDTSGTGVAFTRNPATGEKKFFGEFLMNAQGEDVVAGIRTPKPISALKDEMPQVYNELVDIYQKLEKHYKDMQDIEFTIQDKKLYMLQTRTGKRTAASAVKVAVDMVNEGLIDKKTAVLRIDPNQIDQLLHPMLAPEEKVTVIARGLPASPGAAVGKVVFTAEEAEKHASAGEKVILVRSVTSPEDIGGMHAAQGILTVHGGMTSHAAVVARGMGKCCIAGCGQIQIEDESERFIVGEVTINKGDYLTLDGTTGRVITGEVKLSQPKLSGNFAKIMEWADEFRVLRVRTNADTPHDCQVARDFGAEGIGLCRTEHMFFEGGRIEAVREMILSDNKKEREKALKKILPMQKADFKEIFKVMRGLAVTIRLLDPPLHEFLPHTEKEIKTIADEMSVSIKKLKEKAKQLHEFNPMLGHRGCRLGITYPEIYEMQARAIFEAASELTKEGIEVKLEVMIPLICDVTEFNITRAIVEKTAQAIISQNGNNIDYRIGTMIELPRAAITADRIAEHADFFSFGTNDLTQTTMGLSRDDAGNFLPYYVENGVMNSDPFVVLDREGVGELIKIGVKKGRKTNPDLKIGICGEHGGEPSSVEFCHNVGINYVSCSPFRVPAARLAAAQAAIKNS